MRSRWIIKGTWHGIDVKMKSRERISGSSLSGKCSIDHEDYQKKGPPFLTHAININRFRKSGMIFACGSAYMVSYYCTMNFLPSPGWRKLFPGSSMPAGFSGISRAELTPLSHSLIPHITVVLASPWIRVGVSLLHNDTQEQGREPKCHQQSGWTQMDQAHSAPKVSSCSHVTCGNTIGRDHDRTSHLWIHLWKIAEIMAQ